MKLKNFLCQNFKTKLIRVGRDNDGGYCISEEALKNTIIESYKSENVLDGKVLYLNNNRLDMNNILRFY